MLSIKAISEYKAAYKKEFGLDLSDKEALEQGTRLLKLFLIIFRPIPKIWLENKTKELKGGEAKNGKDI